MVMPTCPESFTLYAATAPQGFLDFVLFSHAVKLRGCGHLIRRECGDGHRATDIAWHGASTLSMKRKSHLSIRAGNHTDWCSFLGSLLPTCGMLWWCRWC